LIEIIDIKTGSPVLVASSPPPKPEVTPEKILTTARRFRRRSGGEPLTLAIVPSVARRKGYSVPIVAELQAKDVGSCVFVVRGPHDAIVSAWPELLTESKRCVLIPDKRNELGAGSIAQIQTAREAGMKTYAWDATRSGLTAKFKIVALPAPTHRRAARVVFAKSAKDDGFLMKGIDKK
jgi:hypothetical protein